jgi:hypothetical protein
MKKLIFVNTILAILLVASIINLIDARQKKLEPSTDYEMELAYPCITQYHNIKEILAYYEDGKTVQEVEAIICKKINKL